jgi:hypothetical protein
LIGCPTQETPALAWYEKDLDDFNIIKNDSEGELEEEEGVNGGMYWKISRT